MTVKTSPICDHRGMLRDELMQLADGRAVAFCEWGTPDGAPVVFHHGSPGTRLGRHPDLGVYARAGVRLITFDRPGYGRSTPRPGRHVVDVAEDVEALAGHLGIARFALFGISGGGPHALACASQLPRRVTRTAIAVGAAPTNDPEFDHLAGQAEINRKGHEAALAGPAALREYLAPYVETARRDPLAMWDEVAEELPEPDRRELARADVRALLPEWTNEELRQGDTGWVEDVLALVGPWGFDLSSIQVPVRLWQGELDVLVPRAHGEYLAAKIPGARFDLVPGAGHVLYDYIPRILDWLVEG